MLQTLPGRNATTPPTAILVTRYGKREPRMSSRLDPTFVLAQIELLRLRYPNIWDEDDEVLLADSLEGETHLHEFLAVVVARMCDADAFAVGLNAMLNDLKERRDRFNDRYEAMRTLAFKVMTAADVRKLELAQATLSIRAGQPKVIVTDEAALPENCIRIKREPDKIAIKEHLARGEPISGAELSNAEPTLAVRVK